MLSQLPELEDVNSDVQDYGLQTSLVIDRDAVARLEHFTIAVSFGSTRSSASLPGHGSHAAVPEAERAARAFVNDLPAGGVRAAMVLVPGAAVLGRDEPRLQALLEVNRTGSIGDGVIFVLPVDGAVRIRTGDRDAEALRPERRGDWVAGRVGDQDASGQ